MDTGLPIVDLRDRAPAHSVIEKLRAEMAFAPIPTERQRKYGIRPIPPTAQPWYKGVVGELETARILGDLPSDWLVLHSVPIGNRGSDIDHVVVAPDGRVLVINTKNHRGRSIWASERVLMVDGQRTDYLRNSAYEAERARKMLSSAVRGPVDVLAIVVIHGASRTRIVSEPRNIAILTGGQLMPFIFGRMRTTSVRTPVGAVKNAAVRGDTWGHPALDSSNASELMLWFMDLRSPLVAHERRTRLRRVGWVLALLGMVFVLPPLVGILSILASVAGHR